MKSYPKINIFLKVVGFEKNYHRISSRFIIFKDIFDEIKLVKRANDGLILNDTIENNIIKKAYIELEKLGFKNELYEFFKSHQVSLVKNIPIGGGLGGGSSNAATFLKLANETLNLKIPLQTLLKISANIGSDVAFFISGFDSANVSRRGEKISRFEDKPVKIELIKSDIFCSTAEVFREFRNSFSGFSKNLNLENLSSKEILQSYENYELNDLLKPCLAVYRDMSISKGEFLSGSGSSKFILKD